ncbi:MAG: chemotaxis protein CheW [Deltaproteobacteria bacterium]|nr:chemotaxis protein CheW [Deltaproteobacteria bacterium]
MSADLKKIKILLVEDTAIMRKIEINTLKSLGYENIIEAVDGNDAIARLQAEPGIDLIISDWNMPNKDGYELLRWVRANDRLKQIPFLMATGEGDKKQEQKAVDAGVSSFIGKPFNPDELKTKIEEALGLRKVEEVSEEEKGPRTSASGKVRLKMAHIQITDHLILGVVKHLIDKGELSPKTFDLEIQCMPGWNPVKQALERGTVDMACVLAPMAMDLYSVGTPIKLILLTHRNGSIFVRNRLGEYREPFQNFFRGKQFFIPHKMSIHHMLAHMFFSKIGLKPGAIGEAGVEVGFEVVPPIKMPEFLNGNAGAGGFMVAEPIGTKAIASGIAELQFLSSELWKNHPCCVVAARDDFIGPYTDAVYEFSEMLVQAGKFIEKKPDTAAEIAVSFLDPNKNLGLKVPLLKNVLTEAQGIKTGDLFPSIDDLDRIQKYMYHDMGIGSLIDLEKFVDLQFAETVCRDRKVSAQVSVPANMDGLTLDILQRGGTAAEQTSKAMLNKEGKYLTFSLGRQEFGIDILKVKEIIGMAPIRTIPQAPPYIKGVVNLRGKVISVMDLRLKFGMEELPYTDRTCIIVLEVDGTGRAAQVGIAVDAVSEVRDIKAAEIEETPSFGAKVKTNAILAMAKIDGGVKILLDIDKVIN